MRIAVCPGSFDPITKGHLDIIHRASKLFDKIIVVVVVNPDKHPSFSAEERMDMIRRATTDIPNMEVDHFSGLLMDYVHNKGAVAIVKGLRAVTDFEYEFQMALINKKLNPEADTLFLTTAAENMYLSSSIVKQIASFGGDIADFVPEGIVEEVKDRLCRSI
ncbi:pantetheine-phosphate adenylyltransferase [Hydrogenoanaerobacterium sp.]|uniref:pantetheine-phosphate adenylyltransferase n=1 Tax=Hydrogenoanaerobacterium sp. TaxID=2953763 RepID=UPI00289EBF60|nr:pantetheine-phosphate adenylyltransferase [Hydrogenoanaerobacterium sp.]